MELAGYSSVTDDFLIVGPQTAPGGSLFLIFRWTGYREYAQGYRQVGAVVTSRVEVPLEVLLPNAAKRQLPHLAPWIDAVIEQEAP